MTNYQVFTWVGGGDGATGGWHSGLRGVGQRNLDTEAQKLNLSLLWKKIKNAPLLVCWGRRGSQRPTRHALNAPLMWGDGTRLFVRHAIRRWCAFDARGFNHPPNLSITLPLCGPLLGLRGLHKANYCLHSTGNPIFKRQRGIVFIGFQKPATDKVNYAVVSSLPNGVVGVKHTAFDGGEGK